MTWAVFIFSVLMLIWAIAGEIRTSILTW